MVWDVLDEDGFLEFVDFCLKQAVLDGLDDVTLHLRFLDLQDFRDLRIAGVLDAVENPRNCLDFDVSL